MPQLYIDGKLFMPGENIGSQIRAEISALQVKACAEFYELYNQSTPNRQEEIKSIIIKNFGGDTVPQFKKHGNSLTIERLDRDTLVFSPNEAHLTSKALGRANVSINIQGKGINSTGPSPDSFLAQVAECISLQPSVKKPLPPSAEKFLSEIKNDGFKNKILKDFQKHLDWCPTNPDYLDDIIAAAAHSNRINALPDSLQEGFQALFDVTFGPPQSEKFWRTPSQEQLLPSLLNIAETAARALSTIPVVNWEEYEQWSDFEKEILRLIAPRNRIKFFENFWSKHRYGHDSIEQTILNIMAERIKIPVILEGKSQPNSETFADSTRSTSPSIQAPDSPAQNANTPQAPSRVINQGLESKQIPKEPSPSTASLVETPSANRYPVNPMPSSNLCLKIFCGVGAMAIGAVLLVVAFAALNVATAGTAAGISLAAAGGLLFFGGGVLGINTCRSCSNDDEQEPQLPIP